MNSSVKVGMAVLAAATATKFVNKMAKFPEASEEEQALKILDDMKENRRAYVRSKLYHLVNNRTLMMDGEIDGPVILDDLILDDCYDSWNEMKSFITCISPQGYGEKMCELKSKKFAPLYIHGIENPEIPCTLLM